MTPKVCRWGTLQEESRIRICLLQTQDINLNTKQEVCRWGALQDESRIRICPLQTQDI